LEMKQTKASYQKFTYTRAIHHKH